MKTPTEICKGSIFLYGRKGFYFDSDDGSNANGASSNGDDSNASNQNSNQDGNQQQQQQDPFANVDLDLLDDKTREAIETARKQFQQVSHQANQARSFQSKHDQIQAQLQQLQNQNSQRQTQSSQQQQQQPVTLEDELYATYVESGIEEGAARKAAQLNSKIFGKFASRIDSRITERMAPIANTVVDSNAESAFESVKSDDSIGIFRIPEVAQRVWEKTQELAEEGQLVSPQVVRNLARIYYVEHQENGGQIVMNDSNDPNLQQLQNGNGGGRFNNPPPSGQGGHQTQTRFTYPGAGASIRRPASQQTNASVLDSDTLAAITATVGNWNVKPKAFRTANNKPKSVITRGGV